MDGDDWTLRSQIDAVCPMCGESVAPTALECPSCGEPLPLPAAVAEFFPRDEQKRSGTVVIVISLLSAVLGAVAGGVFARLWFGRSSVTNDAGYDLSICIGAMIGGVGGWFCCERFQWHRNRAVIAAVVTIVGVLFLGLCVLSSLL